MSGEARFVEVTYRGLKVASRAKLTETSNTSGFVEVEAPLPVGTRVAFADGDQVVEASVRGVVEQQSGTTSPPGMELDWAEADVAAAAAPPEPASADPPAAAETQPAASDSTPGVGAGEGAPENNRRRRRTRKTQGGRS